MFYITVSNGLLSQEHYEKMGIAVWQFMWLLDKVTVIDKEGLGHVLGGKPIQLKDIPFGARITTSRNLGRLESEGYIKLIHTPYGISIRVLKAKKRFNKIDKPLVETGLTEVINPHIKDDKPVFKNDKPNKILQLDRTVDITLGATPTPAITAKRFFQGVENLMGKLPTEEATLIAKFLSDLSLKNNIDKSILWKEIQKFHSYWTELNQTGTKQRWQKQDAFEIPRRLGTWLGKSTFGEKKNKYQAKKIIIPNKK